MRMRAGALTVALLLAALAAAVLLPSAAAQSATPAATCVEDIPGSVICVTPASAAAPASGPCATGAAVPDAATNAGLVADCTALLAAKDPLRGTATLNWSADTAITAWDGITIGGTPARVQRLDLPARGLTGRIPAALHGLTGLHVLQLHDNQLTGAIPAALGDLAALQTLGLQGNRLTGSIPAALSDLAALQTLWLHDNQLTGAIPAALGEFAALQTLALHRNRLTGSIPAALGDLATLQTLWLHGNQLTGSIPVALSRLAQLRDLHLHGNRLTGAIPAALGDLAALRNLALQNNQLSGAIPAALGDLTALVTLRLQGNRLTGAIPAALGDLDALLYLRLGGNPGLTGCLPRALRQVQDHDLARLGLADCPSTYTLTTSAGANGSIDPAPGTHSYAAGTSVTVTATPNADYRIAAWAGDCSGTAATCRLTMNAARTASVTFESTVCEGGTAVPSPAANPALVEDCRALLAAKDTLRGTATLNWAESTAMSSWDGVTIGGTPQRVTKLVLASEGLTGEVPALLGTLRGLTELRLNDNQLTGRIPPKLSQLDSLTHLYLAGNPLGGCIPLALASVLNNDLASLWLPYCFPPTDISYGEHTLTEGTYKFALQDDGPAVVFDVPAGLSLEIVGLALSGSTIGLILRQTPGGSWICVDVQTGEECNRRIVTGGLTSTPDIGALFDRLAESLWVGSAP